MYLVFIVEIILINISYNYIRLSLSNVHNIIIYILPEVQLHLIKFSFGSIKLI